MLALLQLPEQLAKLKDDPSLIPTAVEEFLRWASGNRGEADFTDPYDLDVNRQHNDHVTFSKGSPHLCLGNLLTRTEIRIMFEELIPRIADIRLTGAVPHVLSNFVNGIKKLPVEVTLA